MQTKTQVQDSIFLAELYRNSEKSTFILCNNYEPLNLIKFHTYGASIEIEEAADERRTVAVFKVFPKVLTACILVLFSFFAQAQQQTATAPKVQKFSLYSIHSSKNFAVIFANTMHTWKVLKVDVQLLGQQPVVVYTFDKKQQNEIYNFLINNGQALVIAESNNLKKQLAEQRKKSKEQK